MTTGRVGPLYLAGGFHDENWRRAFHAWLAEWLADPSLRSGQGLAGPLVLLPTAGDVEGAQAAERELWTASSADVLLLPVLERAEAEAIEHGRLHRPAGGLYLAGGEAARLVDAIGGTPLETGLRGTWQSGGPIAAVGGGAAALGVQAPRCLSDGGGWTPGLGWLPDVVLMPDCERPGRLAQLHAAVEVQPTLAGIGIAGDTWLTRHPDGACAVGGARWVCLVAAAGGQVRAIRLSVGESFTWPIEEPEHALP